MKDLGDNPASSGKTLAEQAQLSPAQLEGYGLSTPKGAEKNIQLAFNPLVAQDPDTAMTFGDPNRQIKDYSGGQATVAPNTNRDVTSSGYDKFLNDMYTKAYSRASENIAPESLPLREVDPDLKKQVKSWTLLSDSDLATPRPELGDRNLQPIADKQNSSAKNPGHFYAFGMDQNGVPVTVLDYYRDPRGGMHYDRQWQMRMSAEDANGAFTVDVTELKLSAGSDVGRRLPPINGVQHTLVSNTRFFERPNADRTADVNTRIELYQGFEQTKPFLAVDFSSQGTSFQRLMPNGSLQTEPTLSGAAAQQKLLELSPSFRFFNLYGPPRNIH